MNISLNEFLILCREEVKYGVKKETYELPDLYSTIPNFTHMKLATYLDNLYASEALRNKNKEKLAEQWLSDEAIEDKLEAMGMNDLVETAMETLNEQKEELKEEILKNFQSNIYTKMRKTLLNKAEITNEMMCAYLKEKTGKEWQTSLSDECFKFVCPDTKEDIVVLEDLYSNMPSPRTKADELLVDESVKNFNWFNAYLYPVEMNGINYYGISKANQVFTLDPELKTILSNMFDKVNVETLAPEKSTQSNLKNKDLK